MIQSRMKLIFFLFIFVLLLILIYFFRERIGNNLTFWVVWSVLSAFISLIVENLTGKITIKNKEIRATGGLAVFVLLIIIGVAVQKMEEKTFTFTVFLRNEKQESIGIKGTVRLLINDIPRDEEIDKYGSVIFKNISTEVVGKEVFVELITNDEWNFNNNSTGKKVKILSNSIILAVKNSQNQCCIIGNVVDMAGKSVEGAFVWTDTLLPVTTNERGIFLIKLPEERQREESFDLIIKKGNVEEHATVNRIQRGTIKLKIKSENE